MEENPPTDRRRNRTPRPPFTAPADATPAEPEPRPIGKPAPPITFQPPSAENHPGETPGSAETPGRDTPRRTRSGRADLPGSPRPTDPAQPADAPAPVPAQKRTRAPKPGPPRPAKAAGSVGTPTSDTSPAKATSADASPAKIAPAKATPADTAPAKTAATAAGSAPENSPNPRPRKAARKNQPRKAQSARKPATEATAIGAPAGEPPAPQPAAETPANEVPVVEIPAGEVAAVAVPTAVEPHAAEAISTESPAAEVPVAPHTADAPAEIPSVEAPAVPSTAVEPHAAEAIATDASAGHATAVETHVTEATFAAIPAAIPDAWTRIVADPAHTPELLAATAVQIIGPRARDWAAQTRELYPTATPEALARLATAQFTRFGSLTSLFGALAGSYAPVALVGSAALTDAELALHLAAAYGVDPTDPQRAADLLVIIGVHPSVEEAGRALAAAGRPAYENERRSLVPLVRLLAAQTAPWAVARLLNRKFPGTSLLTAVVTGRTAAQATATRATAYFKRQSQFSQASGSS